MLRWNRQQRTHQQFVYGTERECVNGPRQEQLPNDNEHRPLKTGQRPYERPQTPQRNGQQRGRDQFRERRHPLLSSPWHPLRQRRKPPFDPTRKPVTPEDPIADADRQQQHQYAAVPQYLMLVARELD